MLKVRYISSRGTSPSLSTRSKIGGSRPALLLEDRTRAVREGARDVPGEAAAGDVRERLHRDCLQQREDVLRVDARGLEERVPERPAPERLEAAVERVPIDERLARERVAVGVEPGGGDADDDVTRRDRLAVDDARPLHAADGEPGEVVLARRVEPGQLGRLAADERAAGLAAALRDALDHVGALLGGELAGAEVVEEEQRLGAHDRDVVHAHGDEVDADGVVPVRRERDLELGADAVGAGDEHRLPVLLHVEREEPAEAADPGEDLRPEGGAGMGLDELDEAIALVDVDARVAVGQGHGGPLPRRRDGRKPLPPRAAPGAGAPGGGAGGHEEVTRRGARGRGAPARVALEGDREEQEGGEKDGAEVHRERLLLGVLASIVPARSDIASFRPRPCRAASRHVR